MELSNFTHDQQGLPLVSSHFLVTPVSVYLLCVIFQEDSTAHICCLAFPLKCKILVSSRRLISGFQISISHIPYCHIHTKLQCSAVSCEGESQAQRQGQFFYLPDLPLNTHLFCWCSTSTTKRWHQTRPPTHSHSVKDNAIQEASPYTI